MWRKKYTLLVLLLVSIGAMAQGLDEFPKPNYYCPTWPTGQDSLEILETYFSIAQNVGHAGGDEAKEYFTSDSLTIYGVAAMVLISGSAWDNPKGLDNPNIHFLYAIPDSAYEYLRLYKRTGVADNLYVVAETKVCDADEPAGYLMFGRETQYSDIPRRIFESYFDRPISVIDTFFVGMTMYNRKQIYIDEVPYHKSWQMYLMQVYQSYSDSYSDSIVPYDYLYEYRGRYHPDFGWSRIPSNSFLLVMPIVDSNWRENSGVGEAGVQEAELGRFVSLSPNPAGERVRVVSTIGMSRIEAYDASGRRVHTADVQGATECTLDVAAWPRGLYTLTLHTPLGTVPKRLLLQ